MCIRDSGRIVEEGSHSELMAKKGKYEQLFTTQAERYLEKTAAD